MILQCDNCGHQDEQDKLPMALDLGMRLTIGGIYTDRECPECGALCFPVEEPEPPAKPAAGRMTAEEFRKRWPEAKTNENCLTNIACPQCGNRSCFRISMTSLFVIYDDGIVDHGHTEWDEDSYCECLDCHDSGKVADFTIEGLDE